MKPILLEIVTRAVASFGQCLHCEVLFQETGIEEKIHRTQIEEYPSDLKEELKKLYQWIQELSRIYRHRLYIKLIDAHSFLGFYKSLRHWVRTYPTFIVEKKEVYSGWDKERLEKLIDQYIKTYR